MLSSALQILAIAERHMNPAELEQLVGWISHRTQRNPALAGSGPPLARLDHAITHWLSEGQRSGLACWMARRAALGQPLVPHDHRPHRR